MPEGMSHIEPLSKDPEFLDPEFLAALNKGDAARALMSPAELAAARAEGEDEKPPARRSDEHQESPTQVQA